MAKTKVSGVSVIKVDNAGGTLLDMSAYVDSISALGKEVQSLDVTTFADSAERIIAGIEISQEFTLSGAYDDAATTGADITFAARVGTLGSFEWFPAGTASGKRKISGEALCTAYRPKAEVKGRVEYDVVFKVDGAATIGTA